MLPGLLDQAGAKIRQRGKVANAASRAHGEGEAERIIRVVGAEPGLPESMEKLQTLQKDNPGKVIGAALVKAHTSMTHEWLAGGILPPPASL